MNFNNQDDEENNPFPDDEGYQDKKEAKMPQIIASKHEKIPIKIYGLYRFHLMVEAGGNTSCGIPYSGSLEESIGRAMRACRQNARAHLNSVAEGLSEPTGEEELAERIANYKGNLEDLFMLVYPISCRKSIEKQLGKYSTLEKIVIDNHKDK